MIFIFTFVVSGLFMNMFTTTLNCIFFCFLVDETVNGELPVSRMLRSLLVLFLLVCSAI